MLYVELMGEAIKIVLSTSKVTPYVCSEVCNADKYRRAEINLLPP